MLCFTPSYNEFSVDMLFAVLNRAVIDGKGLNRDDSSISSAIHTGLLGIAPSGWNRAGLPHAAAHGLKPKCMAARKYLSI